MEHCWNAALPIVLSFLLQTTRLREVHSTNAPSSMTGELIGEGDTREGAFLECVFAYSFEVFVEDDAFEGGTLAERQLFNDFEFIGESDTREGETLR